MTLKANDYLWCICESDGNKVTFNCDRCKQNHIFDNTGIAISRFLEISEAFCIIHKDCKESKLRIQGENKI